MNFRVKCTNQGVVTLSYFLITGPLLNDDGKLPNLEVHLFPSSILEYCLYNNFKQERCIPNL